MNKGGEYEKIRGVSGRWVAERFILHSKLKKIFE